MQRVPLFAQGFYRTPEFTSIAQTGRGQPFHYFAFGAAVSEVEVDGFTGAVPSAAHRHPAGRRRLDLADRRPRADRRRLHAGRRLADARGAALGRRRAGSRPAGASTYKLPSWSEMPEIFNVDFPRARRQPGVVFGSKAVGEPPLMLAISVREALRDAVAAFGRGRQSSRSTVPATPERVFFAVRRVRAAARGAPMSAGAQLLRATALFHTPRRSAFDDARRPAVSTPMAACSFATDASSPAGDYHDVRARGCRTPRSIDWRGGFVLPGFVDTHVHFPQLRIIGTPGPLAARLARAIALPEEARDGRLSPTRATRRAGSSDALAAHGTTTALVFGAHFAPATASLFEAAAARGLRIVSGLGVVGPAAPAGAASRRPIAPTATARDLIGASISRGRLLYAVTPRFALSTRRRCSKCARRLLQRARRTCASRRTSTRTSDEIAEVRRLFPWAARLSRRLRALRADGRAHGDGAQRPADGFASSNGWPRAGTSVAHCPSSNAALGSGIFPIPASPRRRRAIALGTDVGGGTGFGMMKEALQAT